MPPVLLLTSRALLVALLAVLLSADLSQASPLAAFGDHTGEDHSFETHDKETLNDIILSGANLSFIDLSKSILTDSFLISATLDGATLDQTDFTNADLTGASLVGVSTKKTVFVGATLDGVAFSGTADKADFSGASLLGADLSGMTKADKAEFAGALYDASTVLAPGMDTSSMVFVPEPRHGLLLITSLIGLARLRGRRGCAP